MLPLVGWQRPAAALRRSDKRILTKSGNWGTFQISAHARSNDVKASLACACVSVLVFLAAVMFCPPGFVATRESPFTCTISTVAFTRLINCIQGVLTLYFHLKK